jgi:O-antigen/teichoic acid export membrane protein
MPARRLITQGTQGRILARNTVFNLAGQLAPIAVALVCVPFAIHRLGVNRFGVVSLAWVLLSYLTMFDFGLGRATNRFVAAALARNELGLVSPYLWTSVAIQLGLGVLGGILFAAATPLLVDHVLKVPSALQGETRSAFYVVALCLPMLLCASGFRGVLEASQRFDLVNIVRALSNSTIFLAPALGAVLRLDLPGIMFLLAIAVVASTVGYAVFAIQIHPEVAIPAALNRLQLGSLLTFGGWITVSTLVVPVLVYADRILLGALVSVAALTFYTVPYEMAFRMQIFPSSFAAVLFPAFTAASSASRADLGLLYARSLKYLILIMGPATLMLVFFAHPILEVWIGRDFARQSALVLQVLAFGMLLNALSQIPAQLLDGYGRPDVRAKIFLGYLPVYVLVAWLLVSRFGLIGAAVAWTARAGFELALFFIVVFLLLRLDMKLFVTSGLVKAVFSVASFSIISLLILIFGPIWSIGVLALLSLIALVAVIWGYTLDPLERRQIFALMSPLGAVAKP